MRIEKGYYGWQFESGVEYTGVEAAAMARVPLAGTGWVPGVH